MEFTLYHELLLGTPDLKYSNFCVWLTKDDKVKQIAEESGVLEELTKETPDKLNTYAFVKCTDCEYSKDILLIFSYFYDYPNPADNGFALHKIIDFENTLKDPELLSSLSASGLDLYSENVLSQIRNKYGTNT